jgi:hypothetical protein
LVLGVLNEMIGQGFMRMEDTKIQSLLVNHYFNLSQYCTKFSLFSNIMRSFIPMVGAAPSSPVLGAVGPKFDFYPYKSLRNKI